MEKCKQKDLLEQMMAEMIGEFPDLHRTIVSERDIYLTYMLKQAAKKTELPRASESMTFFMYFSFYRMCNVEWFLPGLFMVCL